MGGGGGGGETKALEILKLGWRQFEMLSCNSLNLLIRTVHGLCWEGLLQLLGRCLRGWNVSQLNPNSEGFLLCFICR